MQVEMSPDLRKRIAFSTAKMLTEQIKRGEEYQRLERAVSIVICGGVLLPEEPGHYNKYSIRNALTGREFTDTLEIHILELKKLPAEADGQQLVKWGQFFKAETPEELAMAAKTDPVIGEAAALVMELNEDEAERLLADARWRWQMDQAALQRERYREGLEEGEKKAAAIIEAKDQEIEAKDQEIEELRRKLRETGHPPMDP
jgi:predicted transposase/invertase (TIGR01784 family)